MSTTIESLELQIQSNSTSAASGIDKLASSLSALKTSLGDGIGLNAIAKQTKKLGESINSINGNSIDRLNKLVDTLSKLSTLGSMKISSSVGKQLRKISDAASSFSKVNATNLDTTLRNMRGLDSLSNFKGLKNAIKQLKKLPEAIRELNATNIEAVVRHMKRLNDVMLQLANNAKIVGGTFRKLPINMKNAATASKQINTAMSGVNGSKIGSITKLGAMGYVLHRAGYEISKVVGESNKYVEDLNLFTASMGEYAKEAKKYGDTVSEALGIDPAEWMRNQGIFNTIIEGFGVVSDRAYIMSKNLTQLGYDLSSFYNLSFENTMQKLQSGISGELEPLRRLGYDLSVARLQQEAHTLGIQKNVNAMTQAEKAQLRYYAILTQVTVAQGDMARTLEAPANQLRILQAQLTQAARAIGDIFIPALNSVLPYVIAVTKAIRILAGIIARLIGHKMVDIDYSGLKKGENAVGGLGANANNASKGLGKAAKAAKQLKTALLGIDELNIISPDVQPSGGSRGGTGVGGIGTSGLDFELPEYDFISKATKSKFSEITDNMLKWLGISEDITSWSELLHTRLGRILTTVGAIGLGFLAWKVSGAVITGVGTVLSLLKTLKGATTLLVPIGIAFTVTGLSLQISGIKDAIENSLTEENLAQIVGGSIFTTTGAALLGGMFGKWLVGTFTSGAVIAGGVAAAASGIALFVTGIVDAVKNKISLLNGAAILGGATLSGAAIGAIIGSLGGPVGTALGALIGFVVGGLTTLGIYIQQHWDDIAKGVETFVTVTLPSKWNSFKQWVKDLPKSIKQFFDDLLKPIKDFDWRKFGYELGQKAGLIYNDLKRAWESLPKKIEELWDNVVIFFKVTVPQKLEEAIFSIKEWFRDLPKKMWDAMVSAKKWWNDIGDAIINGIVEGLGTMAKAIKDFVGGFVDGFKDALGIHSPSKVFEEIGGFIVDGFINGIMHLDKVKEKVTGWASSVKEWFTDGKDGENIIDHFKNKAESVVHGFGDKIGEKYTTTKNNILSWADGVKTWFSDIKHGNINGIKFGEFANNLVTGFKDKISSKYADTKNGIITWASGVKDWFSQSQFGGVSGVTFGNYAMSVINGFKDKIGEKYINVKSTVVSFAKSVIDWFEHPDYRSLIDGFKDIGKNIIQGFIDGITSLWDEAIRKIKKFGRSVISAGKEGTEEHSPSRAFRRIGAFVIEGFNLGISDMMDSSFTLMDKWVDGIKTFSPELALSVNAAALTDIKPNNFTISAEDSYHRFIYDDNSESTMQTLYRDYVEPILKEMASDIKRQADKEEKTVVNIGNRTITDVVEMQKQANGYVFTT